MLWSIVIYYVVFILGNQISIGDLKLLKGKISYKLRLSNYIAYICLVIGLSLLVLDCISNGIFLTLLVGILSLGAAVAGTWIISKINSKSLVVNLILLIVGIGIVLYLLNYIAIGKMTVPFIIGFYYRNNPFGAPFRKKLLLLHNIEKPQFVQAKNPNRCFGSVDYSFAGKKKNYENPEVFNVTDFGIKPNTREDVLPKVQKLINSLTETGGVIYFPKGKYYFNRNGRTSDFLKINSSHIHIQGELDPTGKPVSYLINCNDTTYGLRNPWLSPFFITTGESIQQSNIFFGLQFLKKKNIVTRSASLSDPGSDGTILTPNFITDVIGDSNVGDLVINVEDTTSLAAGDYVMIGMYNTTADGNLIKDILGVDELHPEWGTALRAGEEQAPSYQWLVGIDCIIDKHTIKLTRPLLRDISTMYIPKVFKVDMLEDIEIKDIVIQSKWNGIFRHHGYPRYYSTAQAQEMDYGWNGINMKRVAHGKISNVIIDNFTNPLYIMDSRNISVDNLVIKGADGHQGIKLYEHACDNLIENVVFYSHYADMMGGEGNAYGNVFDNVAYCNPYFKPVDFDFHGFSEGPMSPPSHNLFINVSGFRCIKGAGAIYNQPACAQYNTWVNWMREGHLNGTPCYINIHYRSGKLALPIEKHDCLFKNSTLTNVSE